MVPTEKKIYVLKKPSKFVRLFFSLAETDRELTGHVKKDISENKFYPNVHQTMLVYCQRHTFLIMITTEMQNDKDVLPLTIFHKKISLIHSVKNAQVTIVILI